MNDIFHYSSYIDEDHYINMCREGTSWIEIDDAQVIKKQWSRSVKDSYSYYFYRKMLSKI